MATPPIKYSVQGTPAEFVLRDYQFRLQNSINTGGVAYNSLDFTSSNITSILTRHHNDLQAIQGGASNDYQHLTTSQYTNVGNMPTWTFQSTPIVTGSRGGNAALTSLLTVLASWGLIVNSTTP